MNLQVLPLAHGAIRSAHAIAKDEGVSKYTIWRRVKAGLLVSVNINGRAYITLKSLERFYQRAANGEFEQHKGVCALKKAK